MATIQSVLGTSHPWGENNDMVTVDVVTDDGLNGVVFRKATSPPLEPGTELQANGNTKQGKPKFKVASSFGGGGSYTPAASSSNNDDKMRSKEQCMRGEAIQAAASLAKSGDEALTYAPKFYDYIAGDKPTVDGTGATPESLSEIDF